MGHTKSKRSNPTGRAIKSYGFQRICTQWSCSASKRSIVLSIVMNWIFEWPRANLDLIHRHSQRSSLLRFMKVVLDQKRITRGGGSVEKAEVTGKLTAAEVRSISRTRYIALMIRAEFMKLQCIKDGPLDHATRCCDVRRARCGSRGLHLSAWCLQWLGSDTRSIPLLR